MLWFSNPNVVVQAAGGGLVNFLVFAVGFGTNREGTFVGSGVIPTASIRQPAERAGRVQRLVVRVDTNTLDAVSVVSALVNGVPAFGTAPIGAGATGTFSADVPTGVALGDGLSVGVDAILAGGGSIVGSATFEIAA